MLDIHINSLLPITLKSTPHSLYMERALMISKNSNKTTQPALEQVTKYSLYFNLSEQISDLVMQLKFLLSSRKLFFLKKNVKF